MSAIWLNAQVYPVRTITTVSPPYPTSLEQYANVEDGHISVTLIPNDIVLQNYPVRLRLVINGGYYKIYTNPSFVHKSIILNNGENISLTGPELAEWFNPDNLIFEGYTKNQYLKTGRLPEGMYQIWFEVFDYYREENISGPLKEIKATIWTFENDPPMLNFPANEKEVPATDPQNIVLNWTQRQAPFSSAGAANQYKLEVWEIIPDDMNVEEAVRTTRPIYSGEAQTTTFNYSSDQPILFPGKKYAWRVQVYDPAGKNRYKNDGYSEVRWFRFGKDCTAPAPELDKIYFTAAGLKWQNDIRFSKYELRWKNKDIANSNWYTKDATGQGITIDKLDQNTSYYVQMRGFCGIQEGEFSQSLTIHTKQDASFACGGTPGIVDSADNIPLVALNKGEIFRAYDFEIETYQVSGGNGSFTGKGFALIPLLKSIKFEVEFSGITVNSKRRMTKGEVKFIYNEKNGVVVSVNSLVNAIIGDKTENNPYEDLANKKTSVNAPITSINVSESGDVTIVTEDGHKETVRASATNGDMVYVGGNSDNAEQSVVDTKSKTVYTATPDKSPKGSGANGLGTAALKQPASNNEPVKYGVTFLPHALTNLGGMDYPSSTAPKGNYNNATIGGSEVLVPWKSVESNKIDRLVAAINGPADSIHFITKNENMVMTATGDKSAVNPNVQTFNSSINLEALNTGTFKQLLVTGVDNTDELKAWYPEYSKKGTDTSKTQDRILAGQVNIAAYDKINLDVCIVEVNGAAVPDALPIEKVLNDIYAPALVQWKVTRIKDFNPILTTLKEGKFDSDHSGSMKYNDCETEVIDAFRNRKDYNSKTLYLFFIGGSKTPTTNTNTKGYMEFNRNFGFIFRDNQDLNELIRTMGHELGHGAFRLRHVFSPECPYPQTQGDTYNLMDYVDKGKATTAILTHNYQWKEVHDWDLGLNWFEEGSEGELGTGAHYCIDDDILKKINQWHVYKTPEPEGKSRSFLLPDNAIPCSFYRGDATAIDGSLSSFLMNGHLYLTWFNTTTKKFIGYGYQKEDDFNIVTSEEKPTLVIIKDLKATIKHETSSELTSINGECVKYTHLNPAAAELYNSLRGNSNLDKTKLNNLVFYVNGLNQEYVQVILKRLNELYNFADADAASTYSVLPLPDNNTLQEFFNIFQGFNKLIDNACTLTRDEILNYAAYYWDNYDFLKNIPLEKRICLIKTLASATCKDLNKTVGSYLKTDNYCEKFVISLFKTVHEKDYENFLVKLNEQGLLWNLSHRLDNKTLWFGSDDNYKIFAYLVLDYYISSIKKNHGAFNGKMLAPYYIKWDNRTVGNTNKYVNVTESSGKISIIDPATSKKDDLSVFDLISLTPINSSSEILDNATAGKEIYAPAIFLDYLTFEKSIQDIKVIGETTIDIISLCSGVGEFYEAASVGMKIYRGIQIALAASDLIMKKQEVHDAIIGCFDKRVDGEAFVEKYTKISMMLNMGFMSFDVASKLLPAEMKDFSGIFKLKKAQLAEKLTGKGYKELETFAGEIDKELKVVAQEEKLVNETKQLLKTSGTDEQYADEIVAAMDEGCTADCAVDAVNSFGCFAANTQVETENGLIPISSVTEGDKVRTFNLQKKIKEFKLVTGLQKYMVKSLMVLMLSNGEQIETTPNHPFFAGNDFHEASTLKTGDTLFTGDNNCIRLHSSSTKDTLAYVYNFTVADNNNYFVGHNTVLVHNACLAKSLNKFNNLSSKVNQLPTKAKGRFMKFFKGSSDDILAVLDKEPSVDKLLLHLTSDDGEGIKGLSDIIKSSPENAQLVVNSWKKADGLGLKLKKKGFPSNSKRPDVYVAAKAYQGKISGHPDLSFEFNGISFDAIEDGKLLDAKLGYGTSTFEDIYDEDLEVWLPEVFNDNLEKALLKSARRQLDAVAGTGIQIEWRVSNDLALRGITKLFEKNTINITLKYAKP